MRGPSKSTQVFHSQKRAGACCAKMGPWLAGKGLGCKCVKTFGPHIMWALRRGGAIQALVATPCVRSGTVHARRRTENRGHPLCTPSPKSMRRRNCAADGKKLVAHKPSNPLPAPLCLPLEEGQVKAGRQRARGVWHHHAIGEHKALHAGRQALQRRAAHARAGSHARGQRLLQLHRGKLLIGVRLVVGVVRRRRRYKAGSVHAGWRHAAMQHGRQHGMPRRRRQGRGQRRGQPAAARHAAILARQVAAAGQGLALDAVLEVLELGGQLLQAQGGDLQNKHAGK